MLTKLLLVRTVSDKVLRYSLVYVGIFVQMWLVGRGKLPVLPEMSAEK